MAIKYRVVWNYQTKVVQSVVLDESGTITNYPTEDYEHAVITNLDLIKQILDSQGYDVTAIDEYIDNN